MAIQIVMRILHIFSAVAIAGGLLGWKFATQPALDAASPEKRGTMSDAAAAAWRPLALAGILCLLISGLYSTITIQSASTLYHAGLGIKILLALHVFASVFFATRPANAKRDRQLTGALWASMVVVLIAVLLRWLPVLGS